MGNFFAELERVFEANAGQTALILVDRDDWTYRDLIRHIDRAASELQAFGVQPGDRVFVQVQKSAENLALYLACLKLGLVYVPLNTAYTHAELDYLSVTLNPYSMWAIRLVLMWLVPSCKRVMLGSCWYLDPAMLGRKSSRPLRPDPEKAVIWRRFYTPREPPAAPRAQCSVMAICRLMRAR